MSYQRPILRFANENTALSTLSFYDRKKFLIIISFRIVRIVIIIHLSDLQILETPTSMNISHFIKIYITIVCVMIVF